MASEKAREDLPSNKLKDILHIQLEVTERLLEAEEQKLRLLKTEIELAKHTGGGHNAVKDNKDKELETQENTLMRIRSQYQRLVQEMQSMGMIHKRKIQVSRSLPAIGMKQTPKRRPSVFDSMVPKERLYAAKMDELAQHKKTDDYRFRSDDAKSMLYSPQQLAEEIEYKDGVVVAGSLDALIQLLIPTESYYPERTFIFAFILCSRMFIQPHQLLTRFSRIFQVIQQQSTTSKKPGRKSPVPHFVQLIREWTETFPYDFRDEKMMRALKDITQICATLSPEQRREVGQLQSTLIQNLSTLDRYEHVLSQVNAVALQKLIDPRTQVDILRTCDNPLILAQQLTHIELERLNNIGPEEFVQTFIKSPADSGEVKKTSNIEAYVEWFNRLSYLVATEICVSDRERNRVRLLEFFVDTAIQCLGLNNFNSFMAIAAGLYMSPVVRLKKTRAKLSSDKFEELEHYLDPTENFKIYRTSLEVAMMRARKEKPNTCVVPFFSLIVKDLYFQNQTMPDKTPSGFIKFEKCLSIARLVSPLLTWKETVLPYERHRLTLNYLMTVPIHTDDELLLVSYEVEPPDTPREKIHYQELKKQLGSYARCIGKQGGSVSSAFPSTTFTAYPVKKDNN